MKTTSSNKTNLHAERIQINLHAMKMSNSRGSITGMLRGRPNPFAVVTLIPSQSEELSKVLGQTEVIQSSLSPRWVTSFETDFEFGNPGKILVRIYDQVLKPKSTTKPMGSALFELAEVIAARGSVKGKRLKTGGTIYCRVQKAPEKSKGTLNLSLRGIKLKNVDGYFGKSDPFFELARMVEASGGGYSWQPVYRSPVVMNDLNPEWDPISVGLDLLCDGKKRQPILITVRDWEKSGKHKFMGSIHTCLLEILNKASPEALGDPKKADLSKAYQLKKKGKHMGHIFITEASMIGEFDAEQSRALGQEIGVEKGGKSSLALSIERSLVDEYEDSGVPFSYSSSLLLAAENKRPSFVDYVSGGLNLQMTVAIDFASSNGDPTKAGSLHYLHPDGELNDYEKAILHVGEILSNYDSDKKFPVFGFGAKIGGVLDHCFQVGSVAEVDGVRGILEAYRGQFETDFQMSGPTVFAEVITNAAEQARGKQEQAMKSGEQYYQILLILTDGKVSSIQHAREAIRMASDAPLSIVIIGIGDGDFMGMQYLDDFMDFERRSGRDICQFVEFQKHEHNKVSLTHATLDEIPDQVVDYFHDRGIDPLPSLYSSTADFFQEEKDSDEGERGPKTRPDESSGMLVADEIHSGELDRSHPSLLSQNSSDSIQYGFY